MSDALVALVTGGATGIGAACCRKLAAEGFRVGVHYRSSEEKANKLLAELPDSFGVRADLTDSPAIDGLIKELKEKAGRIDVLVNNAAMLTGSRQLTPEGFETQFFVNHLAYFMLTQLLYDTLKSTAPARIINIASTAHSRGILDFDNLQLERNYKGTQAYANTKLMNLVFTYELARRLEGTGMTANAVHPGVIHTNLLRNFNFVLNMLFHILQKFFKQPDEGAETPVYLACSPEVADVSGKYYKYRNQLGSSEASYDVENQKRLWSASEDLSGVSIIPDR